MLLHLTSHEAGPLLGAIVLGILMGWAARAGVRVFRECGVPVLDVHQLMRADPGLELNRLDPTDAL